MAEEAVDHAVTLAKLDEKECRTKTLAIHGYHKFRPELGHMYVYGSDYEKIQEMIDSDKTLAEPMDTELPFTRAEVVWAARHEMARSVEDFLARRTRALFLNSASALAMAPEVARIMALELKKDSSWINEQVQKFKELAQQYGLQEAARTHS
jgi:glycerol-3-phosphate dehydrogenase